MLFCPPYCVQETRARLSRFLARDWDLLPHEYAARARAYAACLLARDPAQSTSSVPARLCCAQTLARMGELSRAARALEPSAPAMSGRDTLAASQALHPPATEDLPKFVANFVLEEFFALDEASFVAALLRSPRLSAGVPSGLLFERLRNTTVPPRGGYTAAL